MRDRGEPLEVKIYTDGASRGNPGPGGYGTILLYTDRTGREHRRELSGGYRRTTNNRMEILAAVIGLEALIRPCHVDLYSDSQYLVQAINDGWTEGWIRRGWRRGKNEKVKNVDLWKRLMTAMEPHKVDFHWVKGHAGHPENERADTLAVAAALGEDLPEDEGYRDD